MVLKIERPANMVIDRGEGRLEDDEHDRHQAKKLKVEPPPHPPQADRIAAGTGNDNVVPPPPPPPPPPMPTETHRQHNAYHQHHAHHQHQHQHPSHQPSHHHLSCAGCGVSEGAASGPLLLFEDPEEDSHDKGKKQDEEEKRYCARCMTGKKVRVFWPVDSQWYIADVQQYDNNTGEHLLRYPDGDTEWVRIGEDHTTNTQYKEFVRNHHHDNGDHNNTHNHNSASPDDDDDADVEGNLTRLPSLGGGGGVSFALSGIGQSFGMPTSAEEETAMRLKPPSDQQQQGLFQQLNLDRTESSMSSFGMYPGVGPRQPSFGQQQGGRAPPFQILSPNYNHSFSSKFGTTPSMDYGPPSGHAGEKQGGGPPPLPYTHPPPPHPQQREEGSAANLSATSPGTRDEPSPGTMTHPGNHPWPPPNQYSNANYYDGPPHQMMYSYPAVQPPNNSSYAPKPLPPKVPSSSSSKPPKSSKKESLKSRKALAKAWTKLEDEHLLDLVLQMKHPLKWSIIAQSLSDFSAALKSDTPIRTGKQCRERYVNHLNPRLKHADFTPLEDATIWRLYATIGTQWAKMSKVIPGRTDNNLKNRFHNLKRQLIREEESRLRAPKTDDYESSVYSERVREIPQFLRSKIEAMWKQERHIGVIAANSVQESVEDDTNNNNNNNNNEEKDGGGESSSVGEEGQRHRKFGPYETVTEPIQCGRCGLFMPSVQCGNEMCTKTKWCRVCTKVSMHLGGNVLRECMNLRKNQDKELSEGADKMMNEVWNGSA